MALWTITLEKPGREDKRVTLPYVGPILELAVDRYCYQAPIAEWKQIQARDQGIFIETYAVVLINGTDVLAEFRSLRRSNELPRTFDPARLPT